MECRCKELTKSLKVEGDFCADPIWCNICNYNLNLTQNLISQELRKELMDWILGYGKWLNLETDTLVENAFEIEDLYNEVGLQLTEKVKKELNGQFQVVYSPSTSARTYAEIDKVYYHLHLAYYYKDGNNIEAIGFKNESGSWDVYYNGLGEEELLDISYRKEDVYGYLIFTKLTEKRSIL